MNQLKSGKATGGCGIYAEMRKAGRATALLWLHCVALHLEHGDHPHRLETGVGVPIWKGKDDTEERNNYRGYPPLCARQGPATNFPR